MEAYRAGNITKDAVLIEFTARLNRPRKNEFYTFIYMLYYANLCFM